MIALNALYKNTSTNTANRLRPYPHLPLLQRDHYPCFFVLNRKVAKMPRAPPRNVIRSYQTRVQGIFKKATELLELDREIEIAVFVKKQGYTPLIFTVEEGDPDWPCGIEEFVRALISLPISSR